MGHGSMNCRGIGLLNTLVQGVIHMCSPPRSPNDSTILTWESDEHGGGGERRGGYAF